MSWQAERSAGWGRIYRRVLGYALDVVVEQEVVALQQRASMSWQQATRSWL